MGSIFPTIAEQIPLFNCCLINLMMHSVRFDHGGVVPSVCNAYILAANYLFFIWSHAFNLAGSIISYKMDKHAVFGSYEEVFGDEVDASASSEEFEPANVQHET